MGAFSIPLQVNTPAPIDPLQTIGGLMKMKSQMIENALRQAQTATAQQEMQVKQAEQTQKNRDLADQNYIQSAAKDPANAAAMGRGDFSLLDGNVQPKTIVAARKDHQDIVDKQATAEKATLENDITKHKIGAQTIDSLMQLAADAPDEATGLQKVRENYPIAVRNLVAEKIMAPGSVPDDIQSLDQLTEMAAKNNFLSGVKELALARQKEKQDILTKQAQATEAAAKGRESGAQAALNEQKLKLIQDALLGAHATGAHPADAILPASLDAQGNASVKAEYDAALGRGDLEAAGRALDKAAGQALSLSPAKRAAEVQKAVDTEKATAPTKIQVAGAEAQARVPAEIGAAVGKERAVAALAPPGFQTILDPSTRNKAIADQIKAADEHAKAAGEAQQMEDYVNAAQHGNQAAAANVPITALRAIVNRVNRQELEAQGGQSFARKLTDWAAKGFEGKPSDLTLGDYAALGQIARSKADTVYAGVADNVNALGGKIPRTPPGSVSSGAPAIGTVVDGYKFKGGNHRDKANWEKVK